MGRGPCERALRAAAKSESWRGLRLYQRSVLRPARVDVFVPEEDSSCHAADVFEAALAQGLGEAEGAGAALAVDDDSFALLAAQLADALRQLLEREELRALDVGNLVL